MSRRTWLGLIAAAGAAMAALSLIDAWIVHLRVVTGEGYRDVVTTAGPWDVAAVPVLTAGVVVAMLTAMAAGLRLLRPELRIRAWIVPAGAVVALGLIAATLVPVGQDGHASSIDLSPGWAAFVGTGLAALMAAAALAAEGPSRGWMVAFVVVGVALMVGAGGGRWLVLQARTGSNQSWSEGSYTREAVDGLPTMTLTLGNGRYTLGDRWSGTWESSGWTVSLDNDPACPGSRGTYHAHGHPEPLDEDLRFVMVVDTCEDGARAEALEAGIWIRDAES